jgi:acyl carrier protein
MTTTSCTKQEKIRHALGRALGREPEQLADDLELKSLVAESFALVETVITIQEDLDIRLLQEDLREVETVGGLIAACAKRL